MNRCCSTPVSQDRPPADARATRSVNLEEGVFCCFDSRCGKQGDVLDLWAALKQMSVREAAEDLLRTFELEPAPRRATELWMLVTDDPA